MQGNTGLCSNDPFYALHLCQTVQSVDGIGRGLLVKPVAIAEDGECGRVLIKSTTAAFAATYII